MTRVEGRNGAHPLDLVDVAAGLDEPLAEQRDAGAVAEQEQTLGFGKGDVPLGNFSTGVAFCGAHPRAGRVEARQGCAVRLIRGNPDCREHAFGELPRIAADRLRRGRIFERGRVTQQHDRRMLGAMRKYAPGAWARQGQLDAAREPLLQLDELAVRGLDEVGFGAWLSRWGGLRARSGWLKPVAGLFLDGDIDAGIQPPRERAARLGQADCCLVPSHDRNPHCH
jgi:hypothetical protein